MLAEPGGDWLVAGTVFDPGRPPAPTLWRSGEGAGWEAETLPAEAGARLLAAAVSGDAVVVAGQAGDDREGIALAYAATSGGPFEAVDDGSLTLPGVSLDILAGGEGGFVAAGDRRGRDGGDIAVLTSEDGHRWQVAAGAEALVNEASAPGQGGETWEVATPDSMAGQGPWQLLGCETTSDGVVVVGGRGSADAEKGVAGVWTSPDGRTWTSVESPSFAGDGGFRLLRDIAVAGAQRFAVGQYREDGRTHQALWWSREGGQWELLALPGDLFEGAESESVQDVAVVTARWSWSAGWMPTPPCGGRPYRTESGGLSSPAGRRRRPGKKVREIAQGTDGAVDICCTRRARDGCDGYPAQSERPPGPPDLQ